jgi:tetratricopeptide (TPR) repeat protein
MDPNPGKPHTGSSKRRRSGASGRRKSRSKPPRHTTGTTSFTPPPPPSRSTIRFPNPKKERPVFKIFLCAFLGVFLLVLLGGSHNAVALGLALLLPGIALLLRPPVLGLGKLGDFAVLGLLVCLLLSFVPPFYSPAPDWRIDATEAFGIHLPLTLSVQPGVSFEAWTMAVAGFAWFYAALQWPVNFHGRRWLFFCLSLLLIGMAGAVVWGNLTGARYPGAEEATAFSFFPNRNQTANFLALGGVTTFAYAMEGFRSRSVLPLVGIPASALCLAGLVLGVSRAGVLLYFIGIGLWFLCSLRAHSLPRFFKIGFPIVVVAFSVVLSSNERTVRRIVSFATAESQLKDEFRVKIYKDTTGMVMDAPIGGFGLGTFPAVFPQYREVSANYQRVVHPESDLFWLAAEGGLLALGFLSLFVFSYARQCRGFTGGASSSYRVLALVAVSIFMIHSLIDVPGHRPGTVYFAILFAALALPGRTRPPIGLLPPIFWRVLGGLLFLIGSAWIVAGIFRLPWHSSLREVQFEESVRRHVDVADYEHARDAADDWIASRPLDWRAYFQRAQIVLAGSGNRSEAAADFRRARFVEPILGLVTYEEGRAWLPLAPARAVSAWRETLYREVDSIDRYYNRMLDLARKSPDTMERMARLSEIDPHFRRYFLCYLKEDALMRELGSELARDPGLRRFSRTQRTDIVKNWILRGDLDSAGDFLHEHGVALENTWWLQSLLHKGRADFKEAVDTIRGHIEVPAIPEIRLDEAVLTRLMRAYAVAPKDIMKGTALLHIYVDRGEYGKALTILDRLLESHKPPLYLFYWRAECLYRVEEYIESWYTFETYLKKLWEE